MKYLISLLAILSIAVIVIGQDIDQQQPVAADEPVKIISLDKEAKDKRWNTFKRLFNKKYANDKDEQKKRNVFEENCLKVNEHNEKYNEGLMCMSRNATTRKRCSQPNIDDRFENLVGLNELSDLTRDEVVNLHCGLNLPKSFSVDHGVGGGDNDDDVDLTGVPKSFDWRTNLGYLSNVKNQFTCKSSWAFSAVDSIETQYRIKTNKTLHLSQQNLIDCAYQGVDTCLQGGWMGTAFEYTTMFGISKFKDYLYDGLNNECRFNKSLSVLKTKGFHFVNNAQKKRPSENELVKAIYTIGPISVAIRSNEFHNHKSGIFKNSNCVIKQIKDFNNAMTAVGYGTTSKGEDYFILRNSWGTSWGENGYMKILRNKNLCGLGYYSLYPVLDLE